MVKLIVGVKGTGKTKTLIDLANEALRTSAGNVVCIEKGQKLKYDIKYQARLIDTTEYDINNGYALYGLVCGLYAANYDITHVFIDSALKICGGDTDCFANFLKLADNLSSKNNFECIITASAAPETLPEEILKYTEQ
ncbi:MAG: ATP-binding protein [Oscillospiraceae bacterium]|nr:ATP-binding protein [Oscillospiraceae bacterium]